MFGTETLKKLEGIETPFYFYDLELLKSTLHALKQAAPPEYHVHYALKANANPEILKIILQHGLGADCVSGNEVKRAYEVGFKAGDIVFAGVGKSDREINEALDIGIFCFNSESVHELQILNELSGKKHKKAPVALRINPNVDAYTHKYITTGLEENKFGINQHEFENVSQVLQSAQHLKFCGLHFHIGSQIQDLSAFKNLCLKVNEINQWFIKRGLFPEHINLGGGLGIDYREPDKNSIPNFQAYFKLFKELLELHPQQQVHFELGRCIVGQCGSLISRALYIKKGINTNFIILDAGMTELIRPALYQAYHKIENISRSRANNNYKYDVVGPICESSDCFGKSVELPESFRGDVFAIRSAGAYGEVMSNNYNLRETVKSVYSV